MNAGLTFKRNSNEKFKMKKEKVPLIRVFLLIHFAF